MTSKLQEVKRKTLYLFDNNKTFHRCLYILIILNVVAIILESFGHINEGFQSLFLIFEIISITIFTLEYILRIWIADINPINNNSRINFIFSAYGIIDLLAILPFFLPMFIKMDFRMIRILRLFRLLRVFKLGRYSKSLKTMNSVLQDTKSDLVLTFIVALVLLMLSSTLMYYVEHEAQPEKFQNILHSFWWSVATLTTVGYGDVYPITGLGKLLSGIIAFIGIGFVALPTGIISSAFIERLDSTKKEIHQCVCPECGHMFKE